MDISVNRAGQIVALLLALAAGTQGLYTLLYITAPDVNRLPIWGAEALIFTLLAAFAASPLVHSKRFTVAWGAIFASAVLNVVQVGVGLTMFRPFFEAAGEVPGMMPAASSVVAYSFFSYNAAKVLLALAAVILGIAQFQRGEGLAKLIGGAAALIGVIAAIANTASMAMGRDVFGELPLAGGSGVAATLLLALCVKGALAED